MIESSHYFRYYLFTTVNFEKYYHRDNSKGGHRYFLTVINKGSCRIEAEDCTLEVREGEAFYVPKGLRFHSHYFADGPGSYTSYGFHYFPDAREKAFGLQKVPAELVRQIPAQNDPSASALSTLYAVLDRLLPFLQYEGTKQDDDILRKAKEYLRQNLDCKIAEVAQYCGVCEAILYKAFQKSIGRTPNQVRQELLVESAITLLTTTDRSIADISDSLHFSSTSYFRKIIKKHTGMSPRQIRDEIR